MTGRCNASAVEIIECESDLRTRFLGLALFIVFRDARRIVLRPEMGAVRPVQTESDVTPLRPRQMLAPVLRSDAVMGLRAEEYLKEAF